MHMIRTPITLDIIHSALAQPLPGLRGQALMAPAQRLDPELYANGSRDCRRAAVLFLLYPFQGELHTLLTVRPDTLPHHPGQVAFPGGSRDEDESVLETALREAHEEVGIDPALIQPLGRLTRLYIPPSHFCIQIVLGHTPRRPAWRPNPDEISKLLEIPVAHFFDRGNWGEEIRAIEGIKRRIPYFQIGEHKVWGATAMTIAEFVTAIEELA